MERYRIGPDASVYFVTYSVVEWLPVFVSNATCQVVIDSLRFCCEKKNLCINAFVIMPTHLHMIVFDRNWNSQTLEQTLMDFRKYTGRSLCDFFEGRKPLCFSETFKSLATMDRDRRFWQSSRHPEAIETETFWQQKRDYRHENPCRKGLVRRAAEWRFSSAAFYVTDGNAPCDVPISAIDWS